MDSQDIRALFITLPNIIIEQKMSPLSCWLQARISSCYLSNSENLTSLECVTYAKEQTNNCLMRIVSCSSQHLQDRYWSYLYFIDDINIALVQVHMLVSDRKEIKTRKSDSRVSDLDHYTMLIIQPRQSLKELYLFGFRITDEVFDLVI